MRKTYMTLAAVTVALFTNAQINVTHNDIISGARTVVQSYDLETQMDPGSAGVSQVWDFSNVANDGTETSVFQQADWVSYGTQFPESRLAIKANDSNYVFFHHNQNSFGVDGVVQDVDNNGQLDVLKFVKPIIETQFPVVYGNSYTDTAIIFVSVPGDPLQGFDSAHFRQTIIRYLVTDAYGQMILPMGSFEVLRNNGTVDIKDSTWVYFAGNRQLVDNNAETQYFYEWYTDNDAAMFQLAEMDYDGTNGQPGDLLYLASTPTIGLHQHNLLQFSSFPNPANQFVNIQLGQPVDNASLVVRDVQGKVMMSDKVEGKDHSLDVSSLKNGLYFIQIHNSQRQLISEGKIMILH